MAFCRNEPSGFYEILYKDLFNYILIIYLNPRSNSKDFYITDQPFICLMQYTNKINLCLIIPSLSTGGMERVMSELAGYFCRKSNLEVHLVLYGRTPATNYNVPENLLIHRPITHFNNRLRIIFTIGRIIYVRHTVKRINPDVILSFGEYWNNLVLISLIGLKFHIYISDRSQPGKNLGSFHNFLRNRLYRRAAGFVAQTRYAAEIAASRGWNKNIRVISNPVRKIGVVSTAEREKIVLSVGRLIKTKHFDKLIELFIGINDPDWKLVIVGGDSQKQTVYSELRELIRRHDAEKSIILAGNQPDIDNFYRKSMIFTLMSSSEGFPNVIGEALSAGLPVVAYDCLAGPAELIIDGLNGFLIPLYSEKLFKDKLTLLMKDEVVRSSMSAVAVNSVKKFEIDLVGSQFSNFILSQA